jgi:hypothetical protein
LQEYLKKTLPAAALHLLLFCRVSWKRACQGFKLQAMGSLSRSQLGAVPNEQRYKQPIRLPALAKI